MRPVMRSALALSLAIPLSAMADGISIGIGDGDDIDVSWGTNGYVTLNTQSVTAQAVDKKGRLLVAGHASTGSKVTRLLANGQPDPAFGTGGSRAVSTIAANTQERPTTIIPLADGGMLLVINRYINLASPPFTLLTRVVHVSATGSIHSAFGGGSASFDGLSPDAVRDSQGRLYLLMTDGRLDPESGKRRWWLRRLLSNGVPDTSFGDNGLLSLPDAFKTVMAQHVGELIQVRHSDADNGCDVRVLDIVDDMIMSTTCSEDSGVPLRLFSAPFISPYEHESIVSWTFTNEGDVPPEVEANFNSLAHPLGYVYSFDAARIDLVNPVTAPETLAWTFTSAEHVSRTANTVDMIGHVLADGSMVMSTNDAYCDNDMDSYCAPATLFKTEGMSLDLTPDAPATLPSITFDGLHYASDPLLIAGLTDYASVPVRIVGGEVSLDGETWLSGWLWVHNGSEVRVRYEREARVTVGGLIAPSNPVLAVGDVVTLQFSGSSARLVEEPASTDSGNDDDNNKGGSSGGGSIDWAWFALLGLALAGRRLRRKAVR